VSAISDTQESLRGTVGLVGGMTVCLYVFPPLLAEVRRAHPNLEMRVTVGSADRSIALLRSGSGDLGLLTLPVDASDLVSVPLLREELLLVTYPSHPLATKKRIVPADLDTHPFVLFAAGSVTRHIVEEFFTRERIAPPIIMETENVEIIKAMVRSGLGISIIPWQAAAADVSSRQLFCSRITGASLERQTGWLYPKMGRLPRAVTEVMRVFETMRPRLESIVRPPRMG
jgi:DNA-binding transcriptional LysR family regulator